MQYAVNTRGLGFGLLLRVAPGARADELAAGYAASPALAARPLPQLTTTVTDGQTVINYGPLGGAGGYTGIVYAVDNVTGDDYLYYDAWYD